MFKLTIWRPRGKENINSYTDYYADSYELYKKGSGKEFVIIFGNNKYISNDFKIILEDDYSVMADCGIFFIEINYKRIPSYEHAYSRMIKNNA